MILVQFRISNAAEMLSYVHSGMTQKESDCLMRLVLEDTLPVAIALIEALLPGCQHAKDFADGEICQFERNNSSSGIPKSYH